MAQPQPQAGSRELPTLLVPNDLMAAGLKVFPCKKDKSPSVPKGVSWKDLPPELQRWPAPLIGIQIPDNCLVIDVDRYKGVTPEDIDILLGCKLPWDEALIQTTTRGGEHYAFRIDFDCIQGSDLHKLAGFDTRVGGKGYICTGTPSYTSSGFGVFRLAQPALLPALPHPCRPLLEHVDATPPATVDALPADMNDVIEALRHISPDCGRSVWLKVGMALKTVTEDVTLFDQWSSGQLTGIEPPVNYVQEHIYQQWPGFKPGGDDKIGIGTLFRLAIQGGWEPSSRVNTALAFEGTAGAGRQGIIAQRIEDGPLIGALMQNPTEDSVALAFGQKYAGEYIFMTANKCWYRWDRTRWRADELGTVREVARNLARAYNREGKAAAAKNTFVGGVLGHAQSDQIFSRRAADFDQDNYLLNCPDGTYDLSKNPVTRHEHRPGDHITKLTAVSPQPGGGVRFLQFLQEIFEGNAELIDWVQRALGACLSGAIEDHWMMFWIGDKSRNGKNTLGDLVRRVLGDYAKVISSDTLMAKKNQEHKTEIATLKGLRLAVASEVDPSDFWDESKIKSLTGDAWLSGRFMYQDFIEFPRTHKHLIYGNHRPQLRNIDAALRSRMRIVPFRVSFLGREDPDLPARLWAEASFVLHWLIKGHAGWMAAGKKVGSCAVIDEEVEEYMSSQATVESWVEEHCRRVPDDGRAGRGWHKSSELYSSYKLWTHEMGVNALSVVRFGGELQRIGFKRITADGSRYVGIELKPKPPFGAV